MPAEVFDGLSPWPHFVSALLLPRVSVQTWIAGKWLSKKEQSYAPPGTQFHQFVVPPITEYRSHDCTYGNISQINLPKDTANVHACMVSHCSCRFLVGDSSADTMSAWLLGGMPVYN